TSILQIKLNTFWSSAKHNPGRPLENGMDAHIHVSPKRASKPTKTCNSNDDAVEIIFVCADPSYLGTLGHAHSVWCFGAIADLIDSSMDLKAT
ncbi:hypothetical protein MKW98_026998, partial [Papaver atlanticum]